MNRRDFAKSMAASAALPLLPAGLATAAPAIKPIDLMWAKTIAKAQNNGSASLIAQSLNVPPAVANAIQDKLVAQNVIRAGALPGQTVAVNPTFTGGHLRVAAQAVNAATHQTAQHHAQTLVDTVLADEDGDTPDPARDLKPDTLPED